MICGQVSEWGGRSCGSQKTCSQHKKEESPLVTVFIAYKLAEGATREEFRKWSVEIDQPIASRQKGVRSYTIYEAPEGEDGPWDVIEVIDADSKEAWEAVNGYPEMVPVAERFFELCDRDSLTVTYATKV